MGKVQSIIVCILIIFSLFFIHMVLSSDNTKAESLTIVCKYTFSGKDEIASAGDVNGDGCDDIIIGISNSSKTGQAFIYFGGLSMDDVPDIVLSGEEISDYFGTSVSGANDFNNDGFSDVIVGAPENDNAAFNAGSAYIYYGGDPMDDIPDVILTGVNASSYFGSSVSSAYDLNKDGYDDVIIGAYSDGPSLSGAAYIYFGGDPMDNTSDIILMGENDDKFGYSVSSAGDVNNDGFFDVIVGEPSFNEAEPGWSYLYFGGDPMDSIRDVIFTGENVGDNFGISVSSAGDINGDDFDDVIISAPNYNSVGIGRGAVYLYLGSIFVDNQTELIWFGEINSSLFGNSISNAGDINDDGFDDVIIGAYHYYNGSFYDGALYIYFGNESLSFIEKYRIEGKQYDYLFGLHVSSGGDINSDGYSEILIGSRDYTYLFGPNFAPSIELIEPDGLSDIVDMTYIIEWIDHDPDNDAQITLYYCSEKTDNPKSIQGAIQISEDDEEDSYMWNTSNIEGGSYYIKAKINDGINPEVWVFSSGKVTINHHPTIRITAPSSINNVADDTFPISWLDFDEEDNATVSLYYDTDNLGNDGILIITNIGEDESPDIYTWNTTLIPDGSYYIYAEIDDKINPIFANYSEVALNIHHKMPNLSIQHVGTTPSEPIIGEKVIFNVTLINSGDKAAQNCVVELVIDNVLVDEVEVNEVLSDNGTYNVIFEPFEIKTKIHSLQIIIKMNGEEVETKELTVESQDKEELSLVYVLIPLILIVLVIILFLWYLKKRSQIDDNT